MLGNVGGFVDVDTDLIIFLNLGEPFLERFKSLLTDS